MKNKIVKIYIPERPGQDDEQLARVVGQILEDGLNECESGDGVTTRAVEVCCDDTVLVVECGGNIFEITI